MKHISECLQVTKPIHRSERSELLGYFIERLVDKNGNAYNSKFIAFKLSHLKVPDLYYLKSICSQSTNFGKTFWGSLKVK